MTRVFPEQLSTQLNHGLRRYYLLVGSDPLLHHESQQSILVAARSHAFAEHHSFSIDQHTDWDSLFSECQAMSLFSQRQVFILQLAENGPNAAQASQLAQLISLVHEDLLLIIHAPKITKAQENSAWYKGLVDGGLLVTCHTPDHQQLPRWVQQRCRAMSLSIDEPALRLLCYYYEGNLLALSQALERLSLLWPDGVLTLPRVEEAVYDAAVFTPYHWIDALLAGKSKRALHVLQQLQSEDQEPIILLRTLQREIMILLEVSSAPMDGRRAAMDKLRVWQNKRQLYTSALQRLDRVRLRHIIHHLASLEIAVKKDFSAECWPALNALSVLICQPQFPTGLYHV
ncbi:DNA polymerase III, delta subunit [Rosenbergiella nectarea]|uniref:DNA polymerase III subunit delta n=1 Tax=Rosenbergiella nectarea TaxID=988801 RepID=A0A1H9H0Y0_9GAMM|nr:DNA polymerase III subunit delta [Rosenbergiella nectarea]SEQ56002.1 DNA polymerase III, delta subunit [Rosenbergiella nectarea]